MGKRSEAKSAMFGIMMRALHGARTRGAKKEALDEIWNLMEMVIPAATYILDERDGDGSALASETDARRAARHLKAAYDAFVRDGILVGLALASEEL